MTDSAPSDEVFDIGRIRQLVELMEQHGLAEVDLRRDKNRIRLRRQMDEPLVVPAAITRAAPAPTGTATPLVEPGQRADDDRNLVIIKSPMVGTFYGRANPKAEPFVKVGSRVNADTTVCIIEAMKVFNEIPADVSGTIVAVLVDEEEGVEFGKPLFKVDTGK